LFPEPPTDAEAARMAEAWIWGKRRMPSSCFSRFQTTIGEGKSRTSLDLPGYQTDWPARWSRPAKPVIVVFADGQTGFDQLVNRYVRR